MTGSHPSDSKAKPVAAGDPHVIRTGGRGPFAIVGPSGAGKDTLLAAASTARPDLRIVRRVITRAPVPGDEPFQPVTERTFLSMRAAGDFALDWNAHGLFYGIPRQMDDDLELGRTVIFNASRQILDRARARYAGLRVLWITVNREILAERLCARGRESAEDIALRLDRAEILAPSGQDVTVIDNSGPLGRSVAAILSAIETA